MEEQQPIMIPTRWAMCMMLFCSIVKGMSTPGMYVYMPYDDEYKKRFRM